MYTNNRNQPRSTLLGAAMLPLHDFIKDAKNRECYKTPKQFFDEPDFLRTLPLLPPYAHIHPRASTDEVGRTAADKDVEEEGGGVVAVGADTLPHHENERRKYKALRKKMPWRKWYLHIGGMHRRSHHLVHVSTHM